MIEAPCLRVHTVGKMCQSQDHTSFVLSAVVFYKVLCCNKKSSPINDVPDIVLRSFLTKVKMVDFLMNSVLFNEKNVVMEDKGSSVFVRLNIAEQSFTMKACQP